MDGSRRVCLCPCDPRDQGQYRSAGCKMQEMSTVKLHAVTPIIQRVCADTAPVAQCTLGCKTDGPTSHERLLLKDKRTSCGRATMSAHNRDAQIPATYLRPMSLLLALSGRPSHAHQCLLSGAKRTSSRVSGMSVIDPKRTLVSVEKRLTTILC
jgi:hypothetical protein